MAGQSLWRGWKGSFLPVQFWGLPCPWAVATWRWWLCCRPVASPTPTADQIPAAAFTALGKAQLASCLKTLTLTQEGAFPR